MVTPMPLGLEPTLPLPLPIQRIIRLAFMRGAILVLEILGTVTVVMMTMEEVEVEEEGIEEADRLTEGGGGGG